MKIYMKFIINLLVYVILANNAFSQVKTYTSFGIDAKGFPSASLPLSCGANYFCVGSHYNSITNVYGNLVTVPVFLSLDASGNILSAQHTFIDGASKDDLYPVDVAPLYTQCEFTTICQQRSRVAGQERDGIWAVNVDQQGNVMPIPHIYNYFQWINYFAVNGSYYNNLYPTAVLTDYYNMYICGYAAHNTQYPNEPDASNSDKVGMLIKVPLDFPTAYAGIGVNVYFWNTVNSSGNGKDYDMAVNMKLMDNGTTLFLVGAMNDNYGQSTTLAMRFQLPPGGSTSGLTLLNTNGIHPINLNIPDYTSNGNPSAPQGYYGVDVWEDKINGGYFILSNRLRYYQNIGWSVSHIDANLKVDPTLPSHLEVSDQYKVWANKAFVNSNSTMSIVGQQVGLFCSGSSVTAPSLNPSLNNINPFIANFNWNWNTSTGLTETFHWHKTHLSSVGTASSTLNYLYAPSASPSGSLLGDVGRLYHNFAIRDVNFTTDDIKLFPPVTDRTAYTLGFKSVFANSNGEETNCNNYFNECEYNFTPMYVSNSIPSISFVSGSIYDPGYLDQYYSPASFTTADCNLGSGFYKESNNISSNKSISENNSISLYPNPVQKDRIINVFIPDYNRVLTNFELYDFSGRKVFEFKNLNLQHTNYKIELTDLPVGVYTAEIICNEGDRNVRKITIQD